MNISKIKAQIEILKNNLRIEAGAMRERLDKAISLTDFEHVGHNLASQSIEIEKQWQRIESLKSLVHELENQEQDPAEVVGSMIDALGVDVVLAEMIASHGVDHLLESLQVCCKEKVAEAEERDDVDTAGRWQSVVLMSMEFRKRVKAAWGE